MPGRNQVRGHEAVSHVGRQIDGAVDIGGTVFPIGHHDAIYLFNAETAVQRVKIRQDIGIAVIARDDKGAACLGKGLNIGQFV